MEMTMVGSRATIQVDSQFTSTFPITTGVKQGDALSSFLFDLILEAVIYKMEIRGCMGIKVTQILAYPDDVAIISKTITI